MENVKFSVRLSLNIFGSFLPNLNGIHVWSIKKQARMIFNIRQNKICFDPFDNNVKNLFSVEWLNNLNQHTTELPTPHSDLHTILVDKNVTNYINGPLIFIVPSYIGILQYFITYFKSASLNLIILIVTKNGSKFYALNQRSPLCYTVTYISDYSETQRIFYSNILKKKTEFFCVYENGLKETLPLNFLSNNISVTNFEFLNLEEIMYYGGAIYALHNSNEALTSPCVTINPLFDPLQVNCNGLSILSHKTSACFYEIDAFFHVALKSINFNLFYGDLIAIVLQRQQNIHIYFFVLVSQKFLFKLDITISASEIVEARLLHFADYIIAEHSRSLKIAKNISIIHFKWDKISGVKVFLKDMKNENLLIYDTAKYSEATVRAKNNKIFESVIFEKVSVTVEFKSDKCRLLFGINECIVIDDEEWISMYISFSQKFPLFGKNAINDFESFPESVIYDFVKLVGATSKTLQLFDSKWEFHLIEMDNSDDPKIGFKVKTSEGYKVIAPEIALTIYLKKFINIYEKHIGKSADEIKLQLLNGLAHTDNNKYIVDQYIHLPNEAHAYQFEHEVDANNFLSPQGAGVLSTKVPGLSKLLNKKMNSKIPVIAFHFELSFIYIFDEEKSSYKLSDSWNGKLGKELFISFDEKKPKFFEKAARRFESTCNSVVHNIVQTMAKPLPKTFGYSITSDSENPVLFEYTNIDGRKKTETPVSIISKLLKEHLIAIETVTGEFPTEIAFSLLDDYFDAEALEGKNRIEEELKKVCELRNLECSFVDPNFVPLFKQ